jgi:hypothetical protein|tara:strand:+ start:1131 stop:1943 length:813 start_codon:yes stop_codon:yes gene_type:complete
MAQQTFSGVPGSFTAGEVLSSADQNLLRDYLIAQIKEGMTGDTGEVLPMIMDLTNNRIVLDTGGLEFSDGSTQTVAGTSITFSGSTANGMLTYTSASSITAQSTATYASNTLTLTGSGGGLKMDGLSSSDVNTLDDYEEGTWTAAFTSGGGTVAPNTSYDTMNYTKIGRLVNVSGNVDGFTVSSPTGSLQMTGLPFAVADTPERSDRGCCVFTAHGLVSAEPDLFGEFDAGSGLKLNYGNGTTGGGGASMATLIDAGTYLRVNATYMAAT